MPAWCGALWRTGSVPGVQRERISMRLSPSPCAGRGIERPRVSVFRGVLRACAELMELPRAGAAGWNEVAQRWGRLTGYAVGV